MAETTPITSSPIPQIGDGTKLDPQLIEAAREAVRADKEGTTQGTTNTGPIMASPFQGESTVTQVPPKVETPYGNCKNNRPPSVNTVDISGIDPNLHAVLVRCPEEKNNNNVDVLVGPGVPHIVAHKSGVGIVFNK